MSLDPRSGSGAPGREGRPRREHGDDELVGTVPVGQVHEADVTVVRSMRAPITGRRIRPSSRLTVDGARSNRRATCRAPRPRARRVAIRWRSRSERHRWDGASSSRRTGGTPPRSARHRCPVVRVIQTLWHAPDRPHARHQQPPGVVETADDRRPAVSPRGRSRKWSAPRPRRGTGGGGALGHTLRGFIDGVITFPRSANGPQDARKPSSSTINLTRRSGRSAHRTITCRHRQAPVHPFVNYR